MCGRDRCAAIFVVPVAGFASALALLATASAGACDPRYEFRIGTGIVSGYEYADPLQYVAGIETPRQFSTTMPWGFEAAHRLGGSWFVGGLIERETFSTHQAVSFGTNPYVTRLEARWSSFAVVVRGTARGIAPWRLFVETGIGVATVRWQANALSTGVFADEAQSEDVTPLARIGAGLRCPYGPISLELLGEGVVTGDLRARDFGGSPFDPRGLRQVGGRARLVFGIE
jgi:hypothetical protein